MDEADGAAVGPQPDAALPIARPREPAPVAVPSLRDLAINTLAKYRSYLGRVWGRSCRTGGLLRAGWCKAVNARAAGDVGYVDPDSLRAVLRHCNAKQLACIEDETRWAQ